MKSLVQVQQLSKKYEIHKRSFLAVKDLSFEIYEGETLGIVGESGSGKSTLGKLLLRLLEPTTGKVFFEGIDLGSLRKKELHAMRQQMQMIFQDSSNALNPMMTIQEILLEPMQIHRIKPYNLHSSWMEELIQQVGLDAKILMRYPHELSGGQRQRICIMRALILKPRFIVCDESVSALDRYTQQQIVDLFQQFKSQLEFTYLFISHDLGVVKQLADRLAVIYLGQIVELGKTQAMYNSPLHPYTKALISAIPVADPAFERQRPRLVVQGDPPSPLNPPTGCAFHPRCSHAQEICKKVAPALQEITPGHFVACHFPQRSNKIY